MQKFYFIPVLFILFSCKNNKKTEQGFTTTKSNFEYKIIPSLLGGDSIQTGDIVKVQLIQFIDDSLLNDTHAGMPDYIKIDSSLREFDYSEILPLMKVNDSAICIFSVEEILKHSAADIHPPHFLENRKFIKVFLKVVDKFSADSLALKDYNLEKYRFELVVAFREKAGFAKADSLFKIHIKSIQQPMIVLPNGVYIQMIQKGNGGKIKQADSVAVVYKGKLTDGTLFEETSHEKPFVLKAGVGESVEGFDKGIASLSFGDKAIIYIPTKLAYGASKGADNIPAFSNLIFEVEVKRK